MTEKRMKEQRRMKGSHINKSVSIMSLTGMSNMLHTAIVQLANYWNENESELRESNPTGSARGREILRQMHSLQGEFEDCLQDVIGGLDPNYNASTKKSKVKKYAEYEYTPQNISLFAQVFASDWTNIDSYNPTVTVRVQAGLESEGGRKDAGRPSDFDDRVIIGDFNISMKDAFAPHIDQWRSQGLEMILGEWSEHVNSYVDGADTMNLSTRKMKKSDLLTQVGTAMGQIIPSGGTPYSIEEGDGFIDITLADYFDPYMIAEGLENAGFVVGHQERGRVAVMTDDKYYASAKKSKPRSFNDMVKQQIAKNRGVER